MQKEKSKIIRTLQNYNRENSTLYKIIARCIAKGPSRDVINNFSKHTLNNNKKLEKYTNKKGTRNYLRMFYYIIINFTLGPIVALKLMNKREEKCLKLCEKIKDLGEDIYEFINISKIIVDNVNDIATEFKIRELGTCCINYSNLVIQTTSIAVALNSIVPNYQITILICLISGITMTTCYAFTDYSNYREMGESPWKRTLYVFTVNFLTTVTLLIPYTLDMNSMMQTSTIFVVALILVLYCSYYSAIMLEVPIKDRMYRWSLKFLVIVVLSSYIIQNLYESFSIYLLS